MQQLQQFITNELPKSNRALAFVALMALAAKSTNAMLMDVVPAGDIAPSEFAAVRPDFYRICDSSSIVREKLQKMHFVISELSPDVLRDLVNTNNPFTAVTKSKPSQ